MQQMTRAQNNQLNALDRQLLHNYRQAATTAVQNHERAIRRLQREAATADEERLRYLTWQVERTGGLADNIAIEIANAGETARRMIERENLNMFAGGYRDTVLDINRQLGQAGISTNMQMMNRDAINAIFNGESHGLGRGAFEQVVVLDRQRGNFYYRMATGELVENRTIIDKLRNELTQAITLGEGIPQITRRIMNVSCGTATTAKGKRAEARRIARTETIRALNQGKHLAALQAAEEYDIPMNKKWLSVADERTRTTPPDEFDHAKMNGVTVELEEPFIVGGEELQYPGDPNGSAANVIHCRCTTVNVVDIEALRQQRLENERQSDIINSDDDYQDVTLESLQDFAIGYNKDDVEVINQNYVGRDEAWELNIALREGHPLNDVQQRTVDALDRNMTELPQSINAFRGVTLPQDILDGLDVGGVLPNLAFTCVSVEQGKNFFDDDPVQMLLQIPKGTKAHITKNWGESEIILSRNTDIIITRREYDEEEGTHILYGLVSQS